MRWVDVSIGTPLFHRRRIRGHRELQLARLIADFNRLDKCSRRKNAMPLGTGAVASNLRSDRVSNAHSKQPLLRWTDFRERHHLLPYFFWRCVDLVCRLLLEKKNRYFHHDIKDTLKLLSKVIDVHVPYKCPVRSFMHPL